MNNLAGSYAALGRHADALKLREETLALRKAKLGPDHPDTLWSMNNLASATHAPAGTPTPSSSSRRRWRSKAKLGPDHPETLWSTDDLSE